MAATTAARANARMRNVVRSADVQHRHPDASNRGQAAVVGHRDALRRRLRTLTTNMTTAKATAMP